MASTIKGGVMVNDRTVGVSISIAGGASYKRVYVDVVAAAINKFVIISSTLRRVIRESNSDQDRRFYMDQIQQLLRRAHVEVIHGTAPFQDKYNFWLLDGYVRMLLETHDLKLIAQLLNIDAMLYSVEEAFLTNGVPTLLDFTVPDSIKAQVDQTIEIAVPKNNTTDAYIESLDKNVELLAAFIQSNKASLDSIHAIIVETTSKYLL